MKRGRHGVCGGGGGEWGGGGAARNAAGLARDEREGPQHPTPALLHSPLPDTFCSPNKCDVEEKVVGGGARHPEMR